MNEPMSPVQAETPFTPVSAGALLRSARERAGISISVLAASLKVPERRLEALEAEQWQAFPDIVFVRALASSVCRQLGIDRSPILAALPVPEAVELQPDDSRLGAFHESGHGFRRSASGLSLPQRGRPLLVAAALLLLAGVVLWFWPYWVKAPQPNAERQAVSTSSASSTLAASAAPAAAAPPMRSSTVPAPVPAPVAPSSSGPGLAPPPIAVSSQPQAAVPQVAESGWLRFAASGESWVEVSDASGTVVFRKLLQAGESVALDAPGPLNVLIGRAGATQVSVRGKPMDLAPIARNNVARFEVR